MSSTLEAAAVRFEPQDSHVEEYAHSLSTIRRLGNAAVDTEVAWERHPVVASGRRDFTTAVTEMLKTDEEFREYLDIDNCQTYPVIDGKTCDENGEPVVDIVGRAKELSEQIAESQPEFKAQAIRDHGDLIITRRVDELRPGEMLVALSMEPKKELRQYPQTYKRLGYKEGLAYLQFYCKVDEKKLVAGSYSVDMSDETRWRELFADLGKYVPEGESPNTWIRHWIEMSAMAGEAEAFVLSVRAEYYRRIGSTHARMSITDYVDANKHVVNQFFDNYYRALGMATQSGLNNETLQGLAGAVLQTDTSKLDPEIRQQLMRICNSSRFDAESGKLIDSVIRYAVVEELRKGLGRFIFHEELEDNSWQLMPAAAAPTAYPMFADQLNYLLAQNIETGTRANRSYGGCAGQIKLNSDESPIEANPLGGPQEVFGGKAAGDANQEEDEENEVCEYKGTFCYCCPYNNDGTPSPTLVEITAKRGKDGVAHCLRTGCGASLDSKGNSNKGRIYEKAMKLTSQKKQLQEAA